MTDPTPNAPTSSPAPNRPSADWDDLRFFLAVARTGSVSGAARALGVNHATVSRRVQAFEKKTGTRLFDRIAGGWVTTPAGDEMRGAALRVEEEIQALDRSVVGRDAQLSGKLRVALSDAAAFALMPELRAFAEAYPGIELELAASNTLSNLTRREADVAIRVTETPAEHLVGRRVGTTALALYGSVAYLETHRHVKAVGDHPFLAWDEGFPETASAEWLREHAPNARIAVRLDSMLIAYHAVRAGLGVGFLPCALGDRDADLRRVVRDLVIGNVGMWLLTHPDLRRTARVRSFLDFMAEALARTRDVREGRRPQPGLATPSTSRSAGTRASG